MLKKILNSLKLKKALSTPFLLVPALLFMLAFGSIFSSFHLTKHQNQTFKTSNHDQIEDCLLCSFANSQNQIHYSLPLVFALTLFYFSFILSKINRLKASYLLSSNLARAPPVRFFK